MDHGPLKIQGFMQREARIHGRPNRSKIFKVNAGIHERLIHFEFKEGSTDGQISPNFQKGSTDRLNGRNLKTWQGPMDGRISQNLKMGIHGRPRR